VFLVKNRSYFSILQMRPCGTSKACRSSGYDNCTSAEELSYSIHLKWIGIDDYTMSVSRHIEVEVRRNVIARQETMFGYRWFFSFNLFLLRLFFWLFSSYLEFFSLLHAFSLHSSSTTVHGVHVHLPQL